MKKPLLFFSLAILLSCANEPPEFYLESQLPEVQTNDFAVGIDDVENYLSVNSTSTRSANARINPVTYLKDTVMYIVNYPNGFEVLPGDKRFPIKIAFNDSCGLDMENLNDAQKMWFDHMSEEIYYVKKDTIQNEYCKVWDSLDKKKKYIHTKGSGGWIYHNTRSTSSTTGKNHLLTISWKQGDPYNQFCPFKSTGSSKCPVGCTIVAGGMLLDYLNRIWGFPSQTVATATYNQSNNTYSFSGSTSWNAIRQGDNTAIARLLGHLGVLSGTHYGDKQSGASLHKDLYAGLRSYGINCSKKTTWDVSVIKNSLNSNIPVIAEMWGYGGNNIKEGHTIVIDGFKEIKGYYTDIYIYVNDLDSYPGDIYDHGPDGDPVPAEGPTQETSYTITTLYYLINWGYAFIDNTYYYSTSSINYNYGDVRGIVRFNEKTNILHGFYKI